MNCLTTIDDCTRKLEARGCVFYNRHGLALASIAKLFASKILIKILTLKRNTGRKPASENVHKHFNKRKSIHVAKLSLIWYGVFFFKLGVVVPKLRILYTLSWYSWYGSNGL